MLHIATKYITRTAGFLQRAFDIKKATTAFLHPSDVCILFLLYAAEIFDVVVECGCATHTNHVDFDTFPLVLSPL